MRFVALPLCGFAAALLGACPDRTISAVELDPDSVEHLEIPTAVNRELDLLFVVDNSDSMSEEQTSLAVNFKRFIDVLHTIEGGLPSLHLGVVTSDVGTLGGRAVGTPGGRGGCFNFGDDGKLQTKPGVATAPYLEDLIDPVTGARQPNYQGTLESAFGQIAQVGSGGCNLESHLMSMKRALDGNAFNTGFLRPSAHLAVVFIADEDDCSIREDGLGFYDQPDLARIPSSFLCFRSSTACTGDNPNRLGFHTDCRPHPRSSFHADVPAMVSFLKGLKPRESQLIVAGIFGDPDKVEVIRRPDLSLDLRPSCRYGDPVQTARPAIRLDSFVRSFRNHTAATICRNDLSGALDQISQLVSSSLGSRCFHGRVADPPSCSVVEVLDPEGADPKGTPLPQCDPTRSQIPCWYLAEDAAQCATTETHMAMNIERGDTAPPAESRIRVDCVTH